MSTGTEHAAGEGGTPHRLGADARDAREVPINSLLESDSPRLDGEDIQHIQLLAASEAPLPPILVRRQSMRVVDGMHRLRAALLKGRRSVEVLFFDGTEDEAFVTSVKANMAHGLPLTLADREAAASRMIARNPQRSDRWIAAVTGLAPATVGGIRRRMPPGDRQATTRTGRDGRVRPLSSAQGRRIAGDAIAQRPGASLREIATVAGISPATVRDVRERMRRGDDPVPRSQRHGGKRQRATARPRAAENRPDEMLGRTARDRAALLRHLRKDPSLRFTESGRALLRWLDTRAGGPGCWQDLLDAAPSHCSYIVAELARRCADEWLEVAARLESQLRDMA